MKLSHISAQPNPLQEETGPLPGWAADRLSWVTADALSDVNPLSDQCVPFLMDQAGRLYLGRPGDYHHHIIDREADGTISTGSWGEYDRYNLAGRYGPYVLKQDQAELVLNFLSFYRPRTPQLQALLPGCIRALAPALPPDTIVVVQTDSGTQVSPLSQHLHAPVRARGHRYWQTRLTSEAVETDRLEPGDRVTLTQEIRGFPAGTQGVITRVRRSSFGDEYTLDVGHRTIQAYDHQVSDPNRGKTPHERLLDRYVDPDRMLNDGDADTTFIYLDGRAWTAPGGVIHLNILRNHPELDQLIGDGHTPGWMLLRDRTLAGRTGEYLGHPYVSLWDCPLELLEAQLPGLAQHLRDAGVPPNAVISHPKYKGRLGDLVGPVRGTENAADSARAARALQLHLARGAEKRALRRELGLLGEPRPGGHPVSRALRDIGALAPGHDFWRPTSEDKSPR